MKEIFTKCARALQGAGAYFHSEESCHPIIASPTGTLLCQLDIGHRRFTLITPREDGHGDFSSLVRHGVPTAWVYYQGNILGIVIDGNYYDYNTQQMEISLEIQNHARRA